MFEKILNFFKKEDENKKMAMVTLTKLSQQRSQATIKFKGDTNQYITMVVRVTNDEVILDDLVPPPSKPYPENTLFRLTGNDNGVAVTFKSKLNGHSTENGSRVYIAELPSDVEYLQRRDSYRIKLGSSFDSSVKCYFANKEMELKIKDISASGIAFFCSKEDEELFSIRDTIHSCELELENNDVIFFDFMVYRIKSLPKSANVCGRIIYKDAEHRDLLTKYITKIDREIRRKESKHKQDDLDIEMLEEYEKSLSEQNKDN